jgi:hypothetical protein
MTSLTDLDISKFWIRVYFGSEIEKDFILSTIDRAYRDFNRTMYGIAEKNKEKKYAYGLLRSHMNEIINETLTHNFNQNSFDIWHKESCDKLINEFERIINYPLHYGQAQKWINMTLKYLFAIGNGKINGIARNYKYFHIPIDNIIQKRLISYKIDEIPIKWSRINDYSIYMNYQYKVRNVFVGQIPMDIEFRIFNGETVYIRNDEKNE